MTVKSLVDTETVMAKGGVLHPRVVILTVSFQYNPENSRVLESLDFFAPR